MRSLKAVFLFCLFASFSVVAGTYPHFPFTSQTIGVPGMTAISVFESSSGPGLTMTRAVTNRIDLTLKLSNASGCALSARWEILNYLGLLNVGIGFSQDGVSVLSGLFLGPVRLDWGRHFALDETRWGLLTVSRPGLSVSFGIYWEKTTAVFYGGVTLFRNMRWVKLFARGREVTVSIGGLF